MDATDAVNAALLRATTELRKRTERTHAAEGAHDLPGSVWPASRRDIWTSDCLGPRRVPERPLRVLLIEPRSHLHDIFVVRIRPLPNEDDVQLTLILGLGTRKILSN